MNVLILLSENSLLINLILSLLNILTIIFNWHKHRPHLELYCHNISNFYIGNSKELYKYHKGESIVFYYVKIANKSADACTISECSLETHEFGTSYSSKRSPVRDKYSFNNSGISRQMCLELPLTIPAFGYAEGYIVFPYHPKLSGSRISATLTLHTSNRTYSQNGDILRFAQDLLSQ